MRTYMLLGVIYLSFIALGMPDGALGLAWPIIREDMGMPLEALSVLTTVASISYITISSQNGRLSKYMGTDKKNLLGLSLLVMAYLAFSIAPNFVVLVIMTIFAGTGAGLIDTGLNDFMSKNFSSRYMNWMHCFWGMGAAISPIIMAQMILIGGWRMGYAAVAGLQGFVAVLVVFTIIKGVWKREESKEEASAEGEKAQAEERRYLSAGKHGFLQMLAFFLLVGAEGSLALWISSIMIESRGMTVEAASIFPATFFACIMIGRFAFGFVADKLSNMSIMRIGMALNAVGVLVLATTGSVAGMAMAGLGMAPMFPCLLHESSYRFAPSDLSKLVGYQMAAAGAGGATFALLMGQVLSRVSLEALYPIVFGLAVGVAGINEVLAWRLRRA